MNQKTSCTHDISKFQGEKIDIDELCDDCMEQILESRNNLNLIFKNEGHYQLSRNLTSDFELESEMNLLETLSSGIQLPEHLREYMRSNPVHLKNKLDNTLVVKIFKKGVRVVGSFLSEPFYSWEMVPMPNVRNSKVGESLKFMDDSSKVSYHLLGEGDKSLYLSIEVKNFPKQFDGLSVRKNNRLIHSQMIDESGKAVVSGIVAGEYEIILQGRETKLLKLQVLDE